MSLSGFDMCHYHIPCIWGLSIYRVGRVWLRLHVIRWCHYRGLCVSFYSRSTSIRIRLLSPPCLSLCAALFLSHRIFNVLHVDWPGNPRQPISNGKHHILQLLSLHFSTISVYFCVFPFMSLFNLLLPGNHWLHNHGHLAFFGKYGDIGS